MPPGIKRATAVSWSSDGSMMALGDEVGHVVVQHTTSPTATAEFDVASGDVIELAFSPAADRLAVVAGKELSLWQLSDRPTCLGRFEHPERIVCVTCSPAGDHLSTLCADQRARLFRVSNGVLTRFSRLTPTRASIGEMLPSRLTSSLTLPFCQGKGLAMTLTTTA